MVEMTLEEAEYIARNYLPDEPREDEWRASRTPREPARRERGLDTRPAEPPVDWAAVINMAIKASRAEQSEVIGEAMGEYCNQLADELIAEVRQLIEAAVEGLRTQLTQKIDELRSDFTAQATELFESVALISSGSAAKLTRSPPKRRDAPKQPQMAMAAMLSR
jgi:hypothetical protein